MWDVQKTFAFVVVGSDGVWEMLNETAIGLIAKTYMPSLNAEGAARDICQRAQQNWLNVLSE